MCGRVWLKGKAATVADLRCHIWTHTWTWTWTWTWTGTWLQPRWHGVAGRQHRVCKVLVGALVGGPLRLGELRLRVEHRERDVVQQRPQHIVAVAVVKVVGGLGLKEDRHAPGWGESPQPAHTWWPPHATRHRHATTALLGCRHPPAHARLASMRNQLQACRSHVERRLVSPGHALEGLLLVHEPRELFALIERHVDADPADPRDLDRRHAQQRRYQPA